MRHLQRNHVDILKYNTLLSFLILSVSVRLFVSSNFSEGVRLLHPRVEAVGPPHPGEQHSVLLFGFLLQVPFHGVVEELGGQNVSVFRETNLTISDLRGEELS